MVVCHTEQWCLRYVHTLYYKFCCLAEYLIEQRLYLAIQLFFNFLLFCSSIFSPIADRMCSKSNPPSDSSRPCDEIGHHRW